VETIGKYWTYFTVNKDEEIGNIILCHNITKVALKRKPGLALSRILNN